MAPKNDMKAVVWEGKPYSVSVKTVPKPTIQDPLDAVIKVQLAAICGTDLHIYRDHLAVQKGLIPGHEIVGVVEEVGSGVHTNVLKKGDKVVVRAEFACGFCYNCSQGDYAHCLNVVPGDEGEYPGLFTAPISSSGHPKNVNGGQGKAMFSHLLSLTAVGN